MKKRLLNYEEMKAEGNFFMKKNFPRNKGIGGQYCNGKYYWYLCSIGFFLLDETDISFASALTILEVINEKIII